MIDNTGFAASTTRIAKAIARSGLCSRRQAERWIVDGRVQVNGVQLDSPAFNVSPTDRVLVDGKPLPKPEPVRAWRHYKKKGTVTSNRDPQGRTTVFETLPVDMPRVVTVGRLDFNTEGLLLLANDGGLSRYLELPSTGWLRRYRVRARGIVNQDQLTSLKDGITIDGVRYGPITATVDRQTGANIWMTVALKEGRNREIRRVAAHFGLDVNRLIRVSYGPFQLGDLKPGDTREIKKRTLVEQIGRNRSQQLGII